MIGHRSAVLAFLVFILVVTGGAALGATINVPAGQATIQAGIDAAVNGDVVIVQPGTYKENIDFNGKAITVKSTYQSVPLAVATTIIDGDHKGSVVSFYQGETAAAVIRGFTLTNGTGRDVELGSTHGGGVYCWHSSPTITDNIINGNAAQYGGGMSCYWLSPTLSNNTITDNSAVAAGGGVMCENNSSATITNNTISGNHASFGGGAYLFLCSSTLTYNTISGNVGGTGGGVYCDHSTGPVTHNLITGNTGTYYGGGVALWTASLALTSNTISGNASPVGGGVYCTYSASPTMNNNIIAFNTNGGGLYVFSNADWPSNPVLTYCDVYGNTGGNYVNTPDPSGTDGNFSADPLFVNAAAGSFRLKSQGGHWNGSGWPLDAVTSPCIDTGDPASAFTLEPAPNGGRINMGFDGNTAHASKNPGPLVVAWGPQGTTVGVSANINIGFSTDMARPTAQNAVTINGVKAGIFGGTFSWVGRKMTFNPANNLLPGTSYKVVIGKLARSRAGVSMAKGFTWTFTTKPAAAAGLTVASAPTASGAQITLNLASAADVTVNVRNLAGREIALLQPGRLEAGVQSLVWNGKSNAGTKVPAGTYLLEAVANCADGTSAKAMASLALR